MRIGARAPNGENDTHAPCPIPHAPKPTRAAHGTNNSALIPRHSALPPYNSPSVRAALFLLIALAIFGPFTWLTVRQLLRIHPDGRRVTLALAILGNVMWLGLPFLRSLDMPMRVFRATFGPPWFGWLLLSLLYSGFLFL